MVNHLPNAYVTEADSFVANGKIIPGYKTFFLFWITFCSINTT